jgi:hypothetical protein
MEWKIGMREYIIIWKLGLGEKNKESSQGDRIFGLTSTFHHVSAVFGSS